MDNFCSLESQSVDHNYYMNNISKINNTININKKKINFNEQNKVSKLDTMFFITPLIFFTHVSILLNNIKQ